MTQEERKFYDQLVELMTEWRGEVINRIYRKEKPVEDIAQVPVKSVEEIPQIREIKEKSTKEILTEDKKDISKEYIVVRLLKDIPTFVGVDGRNYTLAKEDVAVLSTVNAKALINRKAAIQMMVNR
jgi:DNA replication factor GINS